MSSLGPFIRVLVVDDSAVVQQLLRTLIDSEADMVVVGTAHDGEQALALVEKLRPDLITMDVSMPGPDGISTAQRIMSIRPTPIAIVTAAPTSPDSELTFEALAAGAVDVIAKPARAVVDDPVRRQAFLKQLRAVASVKVVGLRGGASSSPPAKSSRPPAIETARARLRSESAPIARVTDIVTPPAAPRAQLRTATSLIAIGASTGGPPCVKLLLSALDRVNAPPVVVVQHMGRDFLPGFVAWLDEAVRVKVELARAGMGIKKGHVYVAPGDRHVCVDAGGVLWLSDGPAVHHQRPAVDVLFESIAADCPVGAVGILLTGMGSDGARGLLAMRNAGATTIAQDEASSVVFGMPRAAIEIGAADATGDPPAIAEMLARLKASPLVSLNSDERRGKSW